MLEAITKQQEKKLILNESKQKLAISGSRHEGISQCRDKTSAQIAQPRQLFWHPSCFSIR